MLRSNRYAQQPKSDTLGLDWGHLPLHVKKVGTVNLDIVDFLPVANPELRLQWTQARKWIDGDHPHDVPRGSAHEARITDEELHLLLEADQIEPTSADQVLSTCNLFPVVELAKQRRRLIKHTKGLNDRFDRDHSHVT